MAAAPPCLDRFQAGRLGYKKKMILTGVNPAFKLCPMKCREVTVKKKRVETFRTIRYLDHGSSIHLYIQTARASCTTRWARSRSPNNICSTRIYIQCTYIHTHVHVVAATAFYKEQPVIDFLKDVLGDRVRVDLHGGLQDFMRRQFAKEIKGIYINFTKSMVTVLYTCTQHYTCIH